jgi:hypothetical protein
MKTGLTVATFSRNSVSSDGVSVWAMFTTKARIAADESGRREVPYNPHVMRKRTLVLIFCLAAVLFATTVAIAPVVVAVSELCFDVCPAARAEVVDASGIQSVALAGDITFRGPPSARSAVLVGQALGTSVA